MRPERGSSTFPLLVLFWLMMAFLMAFVFISVYERQEIARVEEEARDLVERLAQTAFQSLREGELVVVPLPWDLHGAGYTLQVMDNSAFVVALTEMEGTYSAVVNVRLLVENDEFMPGGRVYFLRRGEDVVVSASEIQKPLENVFVIPTVTPPEFYHFAKENPREATGIAAVYFGFKSTHPESRADVTAYGWKNGALVVQLSEDGSALTAFEVLAAENWTRVGWVESAWVVARTEEVENLQEGVSCPSIENAYLSGWFHSPEEVLDHLRSRTWRRVSDNLVISIPAEAEISAAAATTNVSTYPTWRVVFREHTIFYRGMPWWELENTPGFIFQSDPELHPVI